MVKRYILFFALIYAYIAFQCTPDQQVVRYIQNGIQLDTKELNLKVQFYADNIVRVVKWVPGGSQEKQTLAVIKDSFPDIQIQISEKSGYINISGDRLALSISKKEGRIEYYNLNN